MAKSAEVTKRGRGLVKNVAISPAARTMVGSEILLKTLENEGVDVVFG